ncbi:MAG: hypothetical protein JWN62_3165 [Acidimicrobiales bacterium]|nr:hypothetical protein [Acidimicrobiales bacterium]
MLQPDEERLREALTRLTAEVQTERSMNTDLERIARLTVELIGPACAASIAMLIDDVAETRAASDRIAFELDVLQYSTDEGPCLDALNGNIVRVGWLHGDHRFPHFAVGATARGVASVLSLPIVHQGEAIGTLNIYSAERDAFGPDAEDVARILAAEAAIVIVWSYLFEHAHDVREELQTDVDQWADIHQAQEVLMAAENCSAEQANRLLQNAAEASGDRLIDAALRVIDAAVDLEHSGRDARDLGSESEGAEPDVD